MKSLRRWTPEVLTSKSTGGASAVNMCVVRVSAVMVSGSGYRLGSVMGLRFGEAEREVCDERALPLVEAAL